MYPLHRRFHLTDPLSRFFKHAVIERGASPAVYVNAKGTSLRDYLLARGKSCVAPGGWSAIRTRFPTSAFRFDADAIIDGAANALLAAQIPLGGLNRNVPEK